jgi:hypothetical protein
LGLSKNLIINGERFAPLPKDKGGNMFPGLMGGSKKDKKEVKVEIKEKAKKVVDRLLKKKK